MRVLGIDTTSDCGSVALLEGRELRAELGVRAEGAHSRNVLGAVEFLLAALDWRLDDVDGYAVAVGPGSFTGIRVGVSTVQGLALATGRPCAPVGALAAIASQIAGLAEWRVPMVEAYRGEVFTAVFGRDDGGDEPEPRVEAPEALLARVPAGSAAFAGSGAERYAAEISRARPHALLPRTSPFLAGHVAALGAAALARGRGCGGSELRPVYVRPPRAERSRDR